MTTENWDNIGSGNGLVPGGTQAITNVDLSSVRRSDINLGSISKARLSITKFSLKVTLLKLHSNIPGAIKLSWPSVQLLIGQTSFSVIIIVIVIIIIIIIIIIVVIIIIFIIIIISIIIIFLGNITYLLVCLHLPKV